MEKIKNEINYKSIFSQNLKKLMDQKNISQTDLINDLSFDKSAVSTWINGTRLPRMDKIKILADYFDVFPSELLSTNQDNDIKISTLRKEEIELIKSYRNLTPNKRNSLRRILSFYLTLNEIGAKKADERMNELTQISSYTE